MKLNLIYIFLSGTFRMRLKAILFLSLFPLTLLTGCEEWWTRGQAPSVDTLIDRADNRFDAAMAQYGTERQDVADKFEQMRKNLETALIAIQDKEPQDKLLEKLNVVSDDYLHLEGKLSIESRAPLGELSNEIRGFVERLQAGQVPDAIGFGLYTARSIGFLASELTVPPPTFG